MKRTNATMLIVTFSLAVLVGCDRPAAETTNGEAVSQSSSNAQIAIPIEIDVEDPNQSNTLTAAAIIAPSKVKAGDTVTFAVRAKTAEGWHVYAFDHAGIGTPTKLELDLPDDVQTRGEWVAPEAKPYASIEPSLVYEGDMMFQHSLKIDDHAAPGPRQVKCKLAYQTCNDSVCNRPTAMELLATVEVE